MRTDSQRLQAAPRRGSQDETTTRQLTVVIVTYNSAAVVGGLLDLLPEAMAGVDGWEVVVADNASDDGTIDVIAAHAPHAKVVEVGRNAGYAAGLNAALRAARDSDAVLLLNPDVRPRRGFAEALLARLDDGVGIVVPRLLEQDGALSHSLRREPTVLRTLGEALLGGRRAGRVPLLGEVVRDEREYEGVRTVDWASGAAQLIDRRCLERVGEWDESFFLYSEETEFALRARDAGWRTVYEPAAVAVHIGGDAPVSPTLWSLVARNRVKLFRRRHGRLRAAGFWLATLLNEAIRALAGQPTHRAAVAALLGDPPVVRRRRTGRRVLIVVQNLPVPADRRVWREAQALTAAGFEVSVISPKANGDPDFERLEGVDLYKYDAPPQARGAVGYLYEFVYCWLATSRLTWKVLRRTGIDVFQACNPPDTYFALAFLLKPLGIKFVFDHHDLCPEVYRARFGRDDGLLLRGLYLLERATFATADHVISTNESYRDIALRRGRLTEPKVTVVRNGPDLDRMRRGDPVPELRKGAQFLLCYLGVMGPQDGVDLVLHVTYELVHRIGCDVHVALLGMGDCYDELVALADELEITDSVTFTGWADDEMIRDYLSTADIGLCPDPKNPFNDRSTMNKVLEYMAHELPMVSFDLHETRLSAGDAAVYVQTPTTDVFCDSVAELLSDAPRRRRMGAIGVRHVKDSLAWDHQADLYRAVFRSVEDAARQEKGVRE